LTGRSISVSLWTGAFTSAVAVSLLEADGCGLLVRRDDTIPERDMVVLAVIGRMPARTRVEAAPRSISTIAIVSEHASPSDDIANLRPDMLGACAVVEWLAACPTVLRAYAEPTRTAC
jgi:hypothetical protein